MNPEEPALDDQLDALAAGITWRVVLDPPELKEKLLSPQLEVHKGPRGVNSYCIPKADGTKLILMGADLYQFFLHFTRAAAAYFLQSEPGGPRPSPIWPAARSAVATTLDWISSPATSIRYPEFDLSPRQAHVARAFAAYTFRFALCHEMAHIVLGHLESDNKVRRTVSSNDVDVLRASHQQEFEADSMGLTIQMRSLPDMTQMTTAFASAVYFVHITALLDARLMLLAHLVDPLFWNIARTHPPYLARLFPISNEAEAIYPGTGKGLMEVHTSLQGVQSEIFDAANKQQDAAVKAAKTLINGQLTGRSRHKKKQFDMSPVAGAVREELLRLFDQSPLGVMRVLEANSQSADADARLKQVDEGVKTFVIKQLVSILPPEFQRFHHLSIAERAKEAA